MAYWRTTELLAEIRSRAQAPVSSSSAPGWQDADLLRMANAELPAVCKRLRTVRQGYFNTQRDTAFTAGTASYRVPTRAMHGNVSLVQRVDPQGVVHHLDRLTESEMAGRSSTLTGVPSAFLFRSNSVVFWPIPDASATAQSMRWLYPRRPNQLIAVASAGVSTTAGATTIVLTATVASLGFTTSTPLDFIQANAPWDSLGDDKTPTGATASTLTFASGVIPSTFVAGDYVCLAGQAPVLQLPVEAYAVVAQLVANRLMREDPQALKDGLLTLKEAEADLYAGAIDRDDEEPASVACEVWA